jgi:hypothetical protein
MTLRNSTIVATPKAFNFRERLREISMFFEGSDAVHETMRRVADKLERVGIAYAIVGGMAVNAHQHRRTTGDVDFLITSDGLAAFVSLYKSSEFQPIAGRSRRFVDVATGIMFDFVIAGMFPGNGKPGPIAFPDPRSASEIIDEHCFVKLAILIELKLAAHRHKDFGDVVELIRVHRLDESYLSFLHPSVHADYVECLEEKRREDEYETRQDEAVTRQQKQRDEPSES